MAVEHTVITGGGSEFEYEMDKSGAVLVNETTVPVPEIMTSLQRQHPEMAALIRWSYNTQSTRTRAGGLFQRDRYVAPTRIFDQFEVARLAVETDDVVSGVLESLESMSFTKMSFEVDDQDEEDVWNQIAADIDLDSRIREMWRELYTCSQFYCAIYWGTKSYKVRGKTQKGNARKKVFDSLRVPLALTVLDPRKVLPVGNFMFNQEKLIYMADEYERMAFTQVLKGEVEDPIVSQMILGPYELSEMERLWISDIGVASAEPNLFLLNPQNVFRHTKTRPQFQKFATVRLRSVFDLLDLKAQLREMDRSHLIGASNFILLVKKGTDAQPASANEINNLTAQVRTVARLPVLVGDHRLSIEIITPKMDVVLNREKYDALDSRIGARLLQMFISTGHLSSADSHAKLARVIAMGLESRRHMIRRSLEKFLFNPMIEANEQFTEKPALQFHPKRITLDFDGGLAAYLIDLRDRGEISRETLLSEFDYSEEDEAVKRVREKEQYDDIFQTAVPFSGPQVPNLNPQLKNARVPGPENPAGKQPAAKPAAKPAATTPDAQGRNRGGNRTTKKAGGAAPGTNQGKSKDQQR